MNKVKRFIRKNRRRKYDSVHDFLCKFKIKLPLSRKKLLKMYKQQYDENRIRDLALRHATSDINQYYQCLQQGQESFQKLNGMMEDNFYLYK